MSMSATTLVTFNVCVPRPSAAFVQLLGSWDNFSKPYTLVKDAKVGKTEWRVCPRFTDIICDGQRLEAEPRDGGLQMGSRYWYFYRVDDEEELVNPTQPTTRACPFLPGQEVNVLEVPQLVERCASGVSMRTEYTMDPQDKYTPLESEQHKSKVLSRSVTPPPSPLTPAAAGAQFTISPRPVLSAGSLSVFKASECDKAVRHRPWSRSSDSLQSRSSWDSYSRSAAPPAKRPVTESAVFDRICSSSFHSARRLWSASAACGLKMPEVQKRARADSLSSSPAVQLYSMTTGSSAKLEQEAYTTVAHSQPSTCSEGQGALNNTFSKPDQRLGFSKRCLDLATQQSLSLGLDSVCVQYGAISPAEEHTSPFAESFAAASERLTEWSSKYNTQTYSTSNDTSAIHSQPITPLQTEFNLAFPDAASPKLELGYNSHDLYALQPAERASALTLHTLRALPDDSTTTPTKATFKGPSPTNRRVEEWVDRSESTMEELRKDMAYLCSWID